MYQVKTLDFKYIGGFLTMSGCCFSLFNKKSKSLPSLESTLNEAGPNKLDNLDDLTLDMDIAKSVVSQSVLRGDF